MNYSAIVSFIWGVADLIRDTFKRGKFQDVILPLTVLRRLDQVLAPIHEKVRARQADLKQENIDHYFAREVKPHVPDSWIDTETRDEKDGKTGKVGYEINFNRYFYKYTPPRPLEEIEAEIKVLETEIVAGLKGISG